MSTPSYREDMISQVPALQLLMKMGYTYLPPEQAILARGGKSSHVLLEDVFRKQFPLINSIEYKGKEYEFSDANINNALRKLKDLPVQDGYISANKYFYDLFTQGESLEQTVAGDKKSFSFQYIDWKHPENNVYHVTEEFSVLRTERSDTYRPDIVLFVNGIPLVVIECKSPRIKEPMDEAISQHLRNQQADGIRSLYSYSNILLSLSVNAAMYATTGTSKEFWSVWKEQGNDWKADLQVIKNTPLPDDEKTILFNERYKYVRAHFDLSEQEEQLVTEQDMLLYNLCNPRRLLDLMYHFVVYDAGVKKIARYQQFSAVKSTIEKISKVDASGARPGGVIWHTQGSGKSLTMVMLAEAIATHPDIKNPKIILVTDRTDLDEQILGTFQKCKKEVRQATTGASDVAVKQFMGKPLSNQEQKEFLKDTSLLGMILQNDDSIITTVVNKFESVLRKAKASFDSDNIFILVDEGHRSHYGPMGVMVKSVFPNASFLAFTGTPLMKKEKNTAMKFGGIIDIYSIKDAVDDEQVRRLLYEGRHNMLDVNEKPLDNYFDKVSESVSDYGKADLKRKFSTRNAIVQSDSFVESTAWDISKHFEDNFQGTDLKGQLVAPNKKTALKYRERLKEIGKVDAVLLISGPDMREGEEDAYEESDDKLKAFWKAMMDKYGSEKQYSKSVINSFKYDDKPEIIIVVDKLLTGFDAPRNTVLYLTRQLREHTLLQAIARVNRVYPGKDYGYIIDYYGNLEHLDDALDKYSGLEEFEEEDLDGAIIKITEEIADLPQAHSELWDIFKEVNNKYDAEAYEVLLNDEAIRYVFYEKLSAYVRLLKLALSSYEYTKNTSEKQVKKYKEDAKFFLALRISVKRRYQDAVDHKEYEKQIQKLIDKHITSDGEVLKITGLVDIFNKEEREAEVEKLTGKAAKADHIASRTIKAINIKMNDDPVHYKRLSQLIREAIDDYRQHRIDEAAYLAKTKALEEEFLTNKRDNVPDKIRGNETAIAFYNLVTDELKDQFLGDENKATSGTDIALSIDLIIRGNILNEGKPIVDWQENHDIIGKVKIEIDDLLYDTTISHGIKIEYDQIDNLVADIIKVAKVKFGK